jgi:oligoendopeptidase F
MPEYPEYKEGRWSLDDLIADYNDETADRLLGEMEAAAGAIERRREALSPDMDLSGFREILGLIEEFASRTRVLQGYAVLRFSEDTQDQGALAFMGRVEQASTDARNRVLFFELWWRSLDDENAKRLLAGAGDLSYYLETERLFKQYTLSEPEEKLVSLKDVNGINALVTLYDMMTNKFQFTITVDGEQKTMSRDALAAYLRHPSAEVREAAYREQFRVYASEAAVLGQIYMNRIRDWAGEQIKVRGFHSPIAVRNLENDIPDPVVSTLLDVCASEARVFHGYFRKKAEALGKEKLRRFDLYAPVSSSEDRNIPYPEAASTVLEAFSGFSPEAAGMAERVLRESHIDSGLRHGKRGGAFCYSVLPRHTPWVLLNYTGEPREVATLAHELGHAIHSMAASGHSVLTFGSSLPLAETASVFSEMLLVDHLLEKEDSPKARRNILFETMDSIYATVLRQAFFVMFEQAAHALASEGRTVDDLSDVYMRNLLAQFGESVDIDEVFRHEWISIPHIFHVPFYCYAYSFGMLLSLALYSRYKREGEAFVPVFMRILAHGGAESPEAVLREAGVDMADPAFWRGGFRVIEDMIGRLESP